MLRRVVRFCRFVLPLLVLPGPAMGETLVVGNWAQGDLQRWERRDFDGETRYRVVEIDGRSVLRAGSDGSASALYRKIEVDLTATPWLSWSWRVDAVMAGLDPHTRKGDDFPARVYVVVRDGWLPWQTRALNYVWANGETRVPYWPNPFTEKAMMIPLREGVAEAGGWRHESVNVRADFRRIFGDDVTRIDGIAIMTDSDNSGREAAAFYGAIRFSD